jgi:hypothetical protein
MLPLIRVGCSDIHLAKKLGAWQLDPTCDGVVTFKHASMFIWVGDLVFVWPLVTEVNDIDRSNKEAA